MRFCEVSSAFDAIEKESSRLKMTQLLADLFAKASPGEAATIAYLSLGDLNPTYVGTQFNFADKSMAKVVAQLLDCEPATVTSRRKKLGDIGLVISESDWEPREDKNLTVTQVERFLRDFLEIFGMGSQELKEKKLLELLSSLDKISAKFIARVVLGKLRLGFSDMTLLDAFSWMEMDDKSLRKPLENAYNISADIGLIVKILKHDGVAAIEKMEVVPGVPIRPAAAERLASAKATIDKIGHCIAQPKLDGFRLQIHVSNKGLRFFSRNLQDMSHMFPEITKAAKKLPVKSLVAEGEAIAYDVETGTFLPFQETVKRRRKHGIEAMAADVPLLLYLFDVLYLDGQSLLDKTHAQRRKKLLSLFNGEAKTEGAILPLDEVEIKTAKELESYFEQNISSGLEGVVVKREDSPYTPGKRNFNWIKLKRQETGHLDDTVDCVILGYYVGHGKRANFGIGALLVGVYNEKEDRFETVAKIGTGLSDVEWRAQKKACDEIAVKSQPKNVLCAKELVPDVWVSPEIVCLIRADEITISPIHSASYALRFPRLMGYRPDKSAKEATEIGEIERLYENQFEGKSHRKKRAKQKRVNGQKTIF